MNMPEIYNYEMKKNNTYSTQFKIIQKHAKPALLYSNEIENQFHNNPIPNGIKKKICKQNQVFINNISASGVEQFHKI